MSWRWRIVRRTRRSRSWYTCRIVWRCGAPGAAAAAAWVRGRLWPTCYIRLCKFSSALLFTAGDVISLSLSVSPCFFFKRTLEVMENIWWCWHLQTRTPQHCFKQDCWHWFWYSCCIFFQVSVCDCACIGGLSLRLRCRLQIITTWLTIVVISMTCDKTRIIFSQIDVGSSRDLSQDTRKWIEATFCIHWWLAHGCNDWPCDPVFDILYNISGLGLYCD